MPPLPPPTRPRGRAALAMAGLLAALSGLAAPGPARAAAGTRNDLRLEMAEVAKQVKLLLGQRGETAIAVGDFRSPAKLAASAGPAISKALTEELGKLGVDVRRRAALEVEGEYRDFDDTDGSGRSLRGVMIKARVVDQSSGAEVVAIEPRGVFNVSTIASLIGLTVELPASADPATRNRKLADAIDAPKVHLAGTRVSAGPGSPYAVEVLVKAGEEYRPRAAAGEDGLALVRLRRGELYAVRLINDSPHDAAVTLTIDGLNLFAFSDNPNYSFVIVPAGKSGTIPGWHRTNKVSDAFQVTEYARSAAAEKLAGASTLGTITASFSAAWPEGAPPPPDESGTPDGVVGRAGDATGKGPPVDRKYAEVARQLGKVRASVSVRYNKDADPVNLPDSPGP